MSLCHIHIVMYVFFPWWVFDTSGDYFGLMWCVHVKAFEINFAMTWAALICDNLNMYVMFDYVRCLSVDTSMWDDFILIRCMHVCHDVSYFCDWLIDWLIVCCLASFSTVIHSYRDHCWWRAAKLRPLFGDYDSSCSIGKALNSPGMRGMWGSIPDRDRAKSLYKQ